MKIRLPEMGLDLDLGDMLDSVIEYKLGGVKMDIFSPLRIQFGYVDGIGEFTFEVDFGFGLAAKYMPDEADQRFLPRLPKGSSSVNGWGAENILVHFWSRRFIDFGNKIMAKLENRMISIYEIRHKGSYQYVQNRRDFQQWLAESFGRDDLKKAPAGRQSGKADPITLQRYALVCHFRRSGLSFAEIKERLFDEYPDLVTETMHNSLDCVDLLKKEVNRLNKTEYRQGDDNGDIK